MIEAANWFAAIFQLYANIDKYKCIGSIISPNWVISGNAVVQCI